MLIGLVAGGVVVLGAAVVGGIAMSRPVKNLMIAVGASTMIHNYDRRD